MPGNHQITWHPPFLAAFFSPSGLIEKAVFLRFLLKLYIVSCIILSPAFT